ncbi:hypothetical protein DYQ86_04620 [Acidobacteria bacterium AB60]|nr:hypothetical protein DYQ86_04620 [Acidobacteria bacterium AB60]
MSLDQIVSSIDAEIDRLQWVRTLLAETARPPAPKKATKRRMSAAARKRIAEAQRKRWAAQRNEGK